MSRYEAFVSPDFVPAVGGPDAGGAVVRVSDERGVGLGPLTLNARQAAHPVQLDRRGVDRDQPGGKAGISQIHKQEIRLASMAPRAARKPPDYSRTTHLVAVELASNVKLSATAPKTSSSNTGLKAPI